MSITPQTKSWLRQSAALDGAVVSQTLLNLLERVEVLEQRPIPGFVDLAAPSPEPAPVATDEEQPLPPHIAITYQPKSVYQPLRTAQPPAAQPAPPPAPAGGLVERVAEKMGPQSQAAMDAGKLPYGAARTAIREVAAWMRENEVGYNAVRWLEQEADR